MSDQEQLKSRKNIFQRIGIFFKRLFSFFTNIEIKKIDRGIFLIVILVHVISIVGFVTEKISTLATANIIAISYIIVVSGFWLWFMKKKFREEEERIIHQVEGLGNQNRDLVEQNEKLKKHEKYSKAYKEIAYAFAQIHNLQRTVRTSEAERDNSGDLIENMLLNLQVFCDFLVEAFENITGKNGTISVCIKTLVGSQNKINEKSVVTTLLRDKKAAIERQRDNHMKFSIIDNTAFLTVLGKVEGLHPEKYFFSNQLPLEKNYKNSSKRLWGQEEYTDDKSDDYKIQNWKLPYKSTIVTGIYPSSYKGERHLLGYICIDSYEMNAFDQEIDTKIFSGIADGLFNTFRDFKNFSRISNEYFKKKKNHIN